MGSEIAIRKSIFRFDFHLFNNRELVDGNEFLLELGLAIFPYVDKPLLDDLKLSQPLIEKAFPLTRVFLFYAVDLFLMSLDNTL